MSNFNPSVEKRINKVGYAYEKMHNDTQDMEKEIHEYCERSEPYFPKFIAMNNQYLELKKENLVPKAELEKRWNVLDAMAEKTKEHLPLFKELIYESKPMMEDIYNFGRTLEKDLLNLSRQKNNKEASEKLTCQLEDKLKPLQEKFSTVRQRIDNCKNRFDEILALYESLIN